MTVVWPLTFLAAFIGVKSARKKQPHEHSGVAMLVGVRLFGHLLMTIGASFAGGGSLSHDIQGTVAALALSLAPIYTFIMSTYDGALLALMFVTTVEFMVFLAASAGLRLSS